MKATIKINMDNAAFENNNGNELARILENVRSAVEEMQMFIGMEKKLVDINGNVVGSFKISK
jgi:hypothetical protein